MLIDLPLLEPRLCDGVTAERDGAGLRVAWAGGALVVALDMPKGVEDAFADGRRGSLPHLDGLASLLHAHGLVFDAARPAGPAEWHGVNLVAPVLDRVRRTAEAAFPKGGLLDRIVEGGASKAAVIDWLRAMFHFTDSADLHIRPLLGVSCPDEAELWRDLHADEVGHWRIYRRILEEAGTGIDEVRLAPPLPSVTAFVERLRWMASESPAAYAASLLFIEQAPTAREMLDDPLYGSLYAHYGFSIEAVRPLWRHSVANGSARHDAIGAIVLANRGTFTAKEADDILASVSASVEALGAVYDEVDRRHPGPRRRFDER